MGAQAQAICARMLTGMLEPALSKLPSEETAVLCMVVLRTAIEKIKAVDLNFRELASRPKKTQDAMDEDERIDVSFIEKERPLLATNIRSENPEGISGGKNSCACHIYMRC